MAGYSTNNAHSAGAIILFIFLAVFFLTFLYALIHLAATLCFGCCEKENLKRMTTLTSRPKAPRGRSVVDLGLTRREMILDIFFLREPGDRATVTLLMRGMPIPASYGFPHCEGGTMCENWTQFVKNFHPAISIFTCDPIHPFTARERFVVYICTIAFNFLLTAFYMRFRLGSFYIFTLVKYLITTVYAVLIRQLEICPCFYQPVLSAANDDPDGEEDEDDKKLIDDAQKLIRWKTKGDKMLAALYVGHVFMIVLVLIYIGIHKKEARHVIKEQGSDARSTSGNNPWEFMFWSVFLSEALNFFVWFVKFFPLFLALFPIHRDMWHTGEPPTIPGLFKYIFCRRRCAYSTSADSDVPRCVEPETCNLERPPLRTLVRIFDPDQHMSTFRHVDGKTPDQLLASLLEEAAAETEPAGAEAAEPEASKKPAPEVVDPPAEAVVLAEPTEETAAPAKEAPPAE